MEATKHKVLIVDHDETSCQNLARYLREEYEVITALSLATAWETYKYLMIEVVVTTYHLPDGTGLDLLQKIRERHKNVQVILLMPAGNEKLASECIRAGIYEVIESPYDELSVVSAVSHAMKLRLSTLYSNMLTSALTRRSTTLQALSSEVATLGTVQDCVRLSASMIHDLQNPAFVIDATTSTILRRIDKGSVGVAEMHEALKKVNQFNRLIIDILRSFRSVLKGEELPPLRDEPLRPMLEKAMAVCEEKNKASGILFEIGDMKPDLSLRCRPVQIVEILVNLINNACQAIATLPEPWVRADVLSTPNSTEILITDCGPGIPEPVRNKIFDYGFTTKKDTGGTGIGLAISVKLMESHGGKIYYDSTSKNTRFVLQFPAPKD